jgi:hypothetical protein
MNDEKPQLTPVEALCEVMGWDATKKGTDAGGYPQDGRIAAYTRHDHYAGEGADGPDEYCSACRPEEDD